MIGTKLAHYEITAKLGEGGMGEVWRATDTKLHRDVAIKLLPAEFTRDEERLARFEREAQLLAQLQHPHIASIYGIEDADGTRALVMELVEGPTLAERLAQGRLPLEESLTIARQIAEALEEAHEKGIVHRDLKPQNVKAPVDGNVKVLDFGLAKAMDPVTNASGGSASQLAASPTLTLGATVQGVILGTAAYMAPEQARGLPADKRADIWAFGVVLHEMLTGQTLFAAETVPDTLARVLTREPDLDALPDDVPPPIRRLLRRCLERQPKRRLRDVGDARLVIDEVLGGRLEEPVRTGAAAAGTPRWVVPAIAGALAVGAVVAALVTRATAPAPPPAPVVRFGVEPPAELSAVGAPKISPDGRHVAFAARDEKGMRIWVRSLDSDEPRPLPGTEGMSSDARPFWSPDSRWLAFFADEQLKKVPLDGGPVQKIADHPGSDGTWGEDGTILFDRDVNDPIRGVPASGGTPRPVIEPPSGDKGGYRLYWPQFLPGGKRFLYVLLGGSEEENGIWMANADGSDRRRVVPGLSRVEYAPPGWLLFVREQTLVAQRFDPDAGRLEGEAIPVADGLGVSTVGGADFSVSRAGVLAFRAAPAVEDELALFDLEGRREEAPVVSGNVQRPRFSPDGRWLAYDELAEDNRDIWLRDLKRGVSTRFTHGPEVELAPLFSPDGERLLFARRKPDSEAWEILSRPLAAGAEEVIATHPSGMAPASISPDGRQLLVNFWGEGRTDFGVVDLGSGSGEPRNLTSTQEFNEFLPALSADGRWLAWDSDESGRLEIYVQPFPGPGRKWRVSTDGGTMAQWSPRGDAIYYVDGNRRLVRVRVETGSGFDASVPEPLFPLVLSPGLSMQKIVLAPSGDRLIALVTSGEQTRIPTSVVVGWDAGLPR